jgi:recombination associated protein RdgC
MAHWLTSQEAPVDFSVDRDLELKTFDDEKSVVRYARHDLELAEIVNYIAQGKVPTQLAMTWTTRVSFMLTAELVIKKIEMLEVSVTDNAGEGFDGDIALMTGELTKLIPALLLALGGEVPLGQAADAAAPSEE